MVWVLKRTGLHTACWDLYAVCLRDLIIVSNSLDSDQAQHFFGHFFLSVFKIYQQMAQTLVFGPANDSLLPFAWATSEGLDKPVHLWRALPACTHNI